MYLGLANRLTRAQSETPALTLELMRASLDPRLTFTRASSATDIINGVLVSFAADTPRISTQNGLLIEGVRTNYLRNSLMAGTVAGGVGSGGALPNNWTVYAANGLTTEVVGTGSQNGFSYLRLRISGVPTNTFYTLHFESSVQVAAAPGEIWTASLFLAQAAGSLSNITDVRALIRECDVNGISQATSATSYASLGSDLRRAAVTRTLTSSYTVRITSGLSLAVTSGSEVDVTFDIAAPQLEKGEFVSSFIPTTTSAATRADESCLGPVDWVNASEGTVAITAQSAQGINTTGSSQRLLYLGDAGATAYHELTRVVSTRTASAGTQTASVLQSAMLGGAWADGVVGSVAVGWANNNEALCFAGGTVVTDTVSPGGMPGGLTVLRLGARSVSSGHFFGYLRNLRGWRRRLSNEQLKVLTL